MNEHDLPPAPPTDHTAGTPPHVLDGWDLGGDPYVRTQQDAPFPIDLAAVLGGALAGKLLALTARKTSFYQAATLGVLVGAAIAAAARRIWRLEP